MEFVTIVIYLSIYLGLVSTTFYVLSYIAERGKPKPLFSDEELPKVSVIIPMWNEEKSIEDTIKSVLASDYPRDRLEVVVVDDASTDNSLALARKFEGDVVKVFHKEVNGGSKAAAFNYGFEKVTGEFIISMDADTIIKPETIQGMVRYFKNKKVMAVTPAMIIRDAKGILARVQQVEYLMGLFLRKAFASLNAIYITPGAFTIYRKSFMDKYGVYEVGNITEDLEMALRIQSKGYLIENCPDAPVYTIPMNTFKTLLIQRRRWYFGLIKNLIKYKHMFSRKYGDLGMFVMPTAIMSVIFSLIALSYLFVNTLTNAYTNLNYLQNINLDLANALSLNWYIVEKALFLFLSSPVILFLLLFVGILGFYIRYATKKVGKSGSLLINLPLYFLLFSVLFGFWWMVSIFYAIFYSEIKWR